MKKIISMLICLLSVSALLLPAAAGNFTVTVTADAERAEIGEEVTFTVALYGTTKTRSGSIEVVPGDGFEVVSGEMLMTGASLKSFDLLNNKGVIAFPTETSFDGDFARITARVTDADEVSRIISVNVKLNPSGIEGSGYKEISVKEKPSYKAKVVVGSAEVEAKSTVTLAVTLQNAPKIKSLAASNVVYDESVMIFNGGGWTVSETILSQWDNNTGKGVAAIREDTDINGNILNLSFTVKDETIVGSYPIFVTIILKNSMNDIIEAEVEAGAISVIAQAHIEVGDATGDGFITMSDVLMLRKYIAGLIIMTDEQITRGDITGDGIITMSDVLRIRKIIAGLL